MSESLRIDCGARLALVALTVVISLAAAPVAARANDPEIFFILDGSGSMWGKAGATTKIEAARSVMAEVVPALDEDVRVGLMAYGHRRKGDCSDIEILVPAGSADRGAVLSRVRGIQPRGKTPISDAVATAVGLLRTKEAETTIVLVSDGIETCAADPCDVVKKLDETGIKFVLHVVGFGVDAPAEKQLRCMADAADGRYFAASDASSLRAALGSVRREVERKVETAQSAARSAGTGLPKLVIRIPAGAATTVAGLRILDADGNPVKETGGVKAETVHPLPPGIYGVSYLLKQPNYGDPTEASIGRIELAMGETRELTLGAIVFDVAEPLAKQAHRVQRLVVADAGSGEPVVTVYSRGNGYYTFKPKPLPAGIYDVLLHYENSPSPIRVAWDVGVSPGEQVSVTLDAAIAFKEVSDTPITGWDLMPIDGGGPIALAEEDGSTVVESAPVLQARPGYGNSSALWIPYIVPPGSYRLLARVKGMTEPLQVAAELEIRSGEMVEFDSGL